MILQSSYEPGIADKLNDYNTAGNGAMQVIDDEMQNNSALRVSSDYDIRSKNMSAKQLS